MAISFVLVNPVLNLFKDTYGAKFLVLDPTDSIVIFFRISMLLGGILASPMITYQLLMFILPFLTTKEKRCAIVALPATTVLFLFHVAFTLVFLVTASISFMNGF